jgi:hypothetical protein
MRTIIGHAVMLPFFLCYRIFSIFMGKRKSAAKIGKILTKSAELFVGLGIPSIADKGQFMVFKNKVIRNFKMFKPLYDVEVISETDDSVEFQIQNCPFTSALKNFGAKELCKYACAGDFMIANRNRSKWKFSRTHSHGTDGICCNHTYCSLNYVEQQAQAKDAPVEEMPPRAQTDAQ